LLAKSLQINGKLWKLTPPDCRTKFFFSVGFIETQTSTEAAKMMRRGSKYWLWADCELHSRSHDEVLSNGAVIDVQSRVSRKGRTQLFIGVYDKKGCPVFEESHDHLPNDTMTTALAWGVGRARSIAAGALIFSAETGTSHSSSDHSNQPSTA
jgi:hypothetical protein